MPAPTTNFYVPEQIEFCRFLAGSKDEQMYIKDMPAKFRNEECLALAAGDNLIEFGQARHCQHGAGMTEKGERVPEKFHTERSAATPEFPNGKLQFDFGASSKLKPNALAAVRVILRDENIFPPELRHVVRLTDEGLKASKQQPMKQAG